MDHFSLQVRRKADPAKSLVKGWIQDWKDMSEVQQETSHKELSGDAALCNWEIQYCLLQKGLQTARHICQTLLEGACNAQ